MPSPFVIFSWHKPFLPQLKAWLDARYPDPSVPPLLIAPNFRPWKYLQVLYAADKRSRVLPRFMPVGDCLSLWHAAVDTAAPATASTLDRVWLLREAAASVSATPDIFDDAEETPLNLLAGMTLDAFYPWGQDLARLIDEMLAAGLTPRDIPACDEVLPAAARMLASLGGLGDAYIALLKKRRLTTPGLMAFEVAASLEEQGPDALPSFIRPRPDRPVCILAGHEPGTCIARIFRALHEAGAEICLHTDPALGSDEKRPHWSCRAHEQWIAAWGAGAQPAFADEKTDRTASRNRQDFFAGYDLHSQLLTLRTDLEGLGQDSNAAIVLNDPSLLMPVLHHVPERLRPGLNIAMGMPLELTSIYRLVEACLAQQQTRDPSGMCHWRELVACLDIPCLGFLNGPDGTSIQPALRRMRSQLLRGLRYVIPRRDVLKCACFADRPEEAAALDELVAVLVDGFAGLNSLSALANALQRLCDYFRARGEALRSGSPVDMEALFRLEHNVIPTLRHALMASEWIGFNTLTHIFKQVCRQENIAFEPGPGLDSPGLQILSVNETGLLSFDAVYLPDATDDKLPGPGRHDPLLPDSLRAMLGLQPKNQQDNATAWLVARLTRSSGRTFFYWQEGVNRSQLFVGKKTRSLFIEEHIWRLEQKAGRLLKAGEPPLRQAACSLRPLMPRPRALRLEDEALDAVRATLDGPLSPTLLDRYLRCPLAFGLNRLAQLKEMDTVNEGDDPMGVGNFFHSVLERFHSSHLGDSLPDRAAAARELVALFERSLDDTTCLLDVTLPPDSLAFLREAGKKKLYNYIQKQPEDMAPVLLEYELNCSMLVANRTYHLRGRIDRMDRRSNDSLVILDYKTSKTLHKIPSAVWQDEEFFKHARTLSQSASFDAIDDAVLNRLFETLADRTSSVQLACYITMGSQKGIHARSQKDKTLLAWPEGTLQDAAFVNLAGDGKEVSFFTGKGGAKEDDKARALRRCPDLVATILMHMSRCQRLGQRRSPVHCSHCPYKTLCAS